MHIQEILRLAPVMPVIVVKDLAHAVPMARALVEGGLLALEVTLRTPVALDAVKAIRQAVPNAVVGVGTVARAEDFAASKAAGAQFAVSPGCTPELAQAARGAGMAFLPGVMTPSDIIAAKQAGLSALKFFPAKQAGGVPMLKAFGGPFPEIVFCPTGGITPESAPEFLALENVACVGGTWVTPQAALDKGDWAEVTRLAKDACALRR
jgi:2-dehydro-3-deoxyphosphogluconate aldolase / (4S)-4-hydroxy-2-oxoglutarate aldolase